jgi:hypothetical protein
LETTSDFVRPDLSGISRNAEFRQGDTQRPRHIRRMEADDASLPERDGDDGRICRRPQVNRASGHLKGSGDLFRRCQARQQHHSRTTNAPGGSEAVLGRIAAAVAHAANQRRRSANGNL